MLGSLLLQESHVDLMRENRRVITRVSTEESVEWGSDDVFLQVDPEVSIASVPLIIKQWDFPTGFPNMQKIRSMANTRLWYFQVCSAGLSSHFNTTFMILEE